MRPGPAGAKLGAVDIPLVPLGRTELVVSRLGLGLAALGRPQYMVLGHDTDLGPDKSPAALEARCHDMLDRALARGVRYVDAARSYGRAEEFLAHWLAARGDAPAPVVGSKWGYAYTADWKPDPEAHEVKEHSRARFESQLGESRALLGAHLDLYQVHSATRESGVLTDEGLLDALARLRDEGVVIGLSTTGPAQAATIRDALRIRRGGERLFGVVQSTWNPIEPSAAPALEEARAEGLGVIVKEALANGRLAGRGDDPLARGIADEARRLGTTPDALALAAALALPFVDVVLSGAATPAQLESNVRGFALPAGAIDADRLARFVEPPEAYWTGRKSLPWT